MVRPRPEPVGLEIILFSPDADRGEKAIREPKIGML